MKNMKYLLIVTSLVLLPYLSVLAEVELQELTIQDTSGFTRAVSQVEGLGNIQFELVDAAGTAAQGAEVTLTSVATGETITAVAANGSVFFDAVSPGSWTVATNTPGITFTNVAISSSAALAPAAGAAAVSGLGGLGGGAAAAGGVAAVGAGAVGIAAATDSNNSDSSPLSPSS